MNAPRAMRLTRPTIAFALAALMLIGCRGAEPTRGWSLAVETDAEPVQAVIDRLCPHLPVPPAPTQPVEGTLPPAIAQVAADTARLRGLELLAPVGPRAVSAAQMRIGLEQGFDQMFPSEQYARRSLAWRTIGVLGPGIDIRQELSTFGGSVLGYYDTITGELVYLGGDEPTADERVTLAHELVHAIEDQHFGLERLDAMTSACDDEGLTAALGLVEGSAMHFMGVYHDTVLTDAERAEVAAAGGGGASMPAPFIVDTQWWPYAAGPRFVEAMLARGGVEALDAAFIDPPVSTEQVLHPERFPDDVPSEVVVPDLGPALGGGWKDLDAQIVGEAWLAALLRLRPETAGDADRAAAGWDGGAYRAWSEGDAAVVVLVTTWDSADEAAEFAEALGRWILPRADTAMIVEASGTTVSAVFASDPADLALLRDAGVLAGVP